LFKFLTFFLGFLGKQTEGYEGIPFWFWDPKDFGGGVLDGVGGRRES
jgi:hypothetical protein